METKKIDYLEEVKSHLEDYCDNLVFNYQKSVDSKLANLILNVKSLKEELETLRDGFENLQYNVNTIEDNQTDHYYDIEDIKDRISDIEDNLEKNKISIREDMPQGVKLSAKKTPKIDAHF